MFEAPYADARGLVCDALQLLLPPARETVDQYAVLHRRLPKKTGLGFDPWTNEEAPYLVAPQQTLTSYLHTTTAIVGPAQIGKTAIGENGLLHAVGQSPRNMLWYMQTDDGVEAYVKKIINQMIRIHPEMSQRIGDRPEDNAQHFKRFDGMVVEFLSATDSNLINKNAPFIVADEYDAYDPSLGDPKSRLDTRRQYYGRLSMLLALSHPDRALGLDPVKHWRDGIMRVYADSDRRVWYWPCPHCGVWSSPVPIAKRLMTLEWPKDGTLDEIQRSAHLLCPVNGCVIEDKQRRAMNLAAFRSPFGGWIGQGQEIAEDGTVTGELIPHDTAGFWIVGAMSPFLLNGIGGLARELVKAEREFEVSGDDKTVKEVTVKQIGIPYTVKGPVGTVDAETLAERAINETYWASEKDAPVIPEGVRFLTAWVDVQPNYFDGLVRGFGIGGESWVIDNFRALADTITDRASWDALFEELLKKRYPLASEASRGMAIRVIGSDSAGAAGTTDQAYAAWRRLKAKRLTRNHGVIDGRDVWNVILTKGVGSANAPLLSVVYPDTQRKDRKVVHTGTVPLLLFGANKFKDDLAGQLRHALPGPGYVHIPRALRSKEPPHVNFEQLVAEKRDANGRWDKTQPGARNEMLDKMVGCHVLAHLHGLARLEGRKWEQPPSWAATWDVNSMIAPMDPKAAAEAAAARKPKSITDLLGPR
jgi:phage terminase large subunit GpA-like protein